MTAPVAFDPRRYTVIAHGDLLLWNPVTPAHIDDWIAGLGLSAESRVLDVGCGRGELLMRTVERTGCQGTGVDHLVPVVAAARAEAERRGLDTRITLLAESFDANRFAPDTFDLAACIGATHAVSDFEQALRVLSRLVRPGGHLLVGEGYWRQDPPPEYLAFLGAEPDELLTHEGNLSLARTLGLEVVRSHRATEAEWSLYEDTYADNVLRFVSENPQDPEADAMRRRIESWREAYLRWGRRTLGFGLYLLRRPR